MKPDTLPLPYSTLKLAFISTNVLDLLASKRATPEQAAHRLPGSKISLIFIHGVYECIAIENIVPGASVEYDSESLRWGAN